MSDTETETQTTGTTFTQEQVNSFVAEERRKADEKIAAVQKDAESNKALAAQADERIKKIEDDLSKSNHSTLRYKVALDAGLPMAVAERLQGADEEALRKDASTLSELLAKPEAEKPAKLAGPGEGPVEEGASMNDMIRKAAGRS